MKQFNRADAERLVQTYSDLILRLAYTYLKSTHDAEDICQNIFLNTFADCLLHSLTDGHCTDRAIPSYPDRAWQKYVTCTVCLPGVLWFAS